MSASASQKAAQPAHKALRDPFLERIPSPILVGGSLIVLLAVWEFVVVIGWVPELVLPRASDTGKALVQVLGNLFTGGHVWVNFKVTMEEAALGLFFAGIIGFVVGALIAETTFGKRVIQPYMVALYAAPKVALAPVFVAWFGFDTTPKVVMAVTIAFFPVMVDTAAGLAGVDEDADKMFATMRASRLQRFFKLKLPNALPFVFAGLKSAAVLSLIGALVAEFSGGGRGIGILIQTASLRFDLDVVFAYVILLSVTAFAIYWLIDQIERRVVFWRKAGFIPTES
ncbi:ABC transporter permease [Sinisalibacter aestuarii]|uniref:ABC transporter permease n=1 Tax=Sinisalibacter aestuarii TaxID=2949426 RepID=A0ABQ5LXC1_9RHOB|nr:ABC transporter permease [Sinisalibacter aestuarii]GKY89629.1 ABC transporter permease [Sinisalibacter aestuarii]